jgi:hypothetical protein
MATQQRAAFLFIANSHSLQQSPLAKCFGFQKRIPALEEASEGAAKAGNVTPHAQAEGIVPHPPPKR